MRLREATFSALLPPDVPARLVPPTKPPQVWRVVVLAKNGEALTETDFYRSVISEVDDDGKIAHYLDMVYALFSAAKIPDFRFAFQGLTVTCKEAHAFKYKNSTEKLWELKSGKKDRIYFYVLGKSKIIVLLEAHHKKSQTTPREIKVRAEPAIKWVVDNESKLKFI